MGIRGGQLSFEIAASANRVLRTIGSLTRRTPTRDLHMAFKILCLYDLITKLCREQATVIINHEHVMFGTLAKAKMSKESIKGSDLVEVGHTIDQFCLDSGYVLEQ
jgi:hypothetical protein